MKDGAPGDPESDAKQTDVPRREAWPTSVGTVLSTSEHSALIAETDGSFAIYSGNQVGVRVASEGAPSSEAAYMFARVRVPASEVQRAMTNPARVVTLSLEEMVTGSDWLLHRPASGKDSSDLFFAAGDPWLSGLIQIVYEVDSSVTSRYQVIKHHPPIGADLKVGSSYFETPLVDDPARPALRYSETDTRKWPATPPSWR